MVAPFTMGICSVFFFCALAALFSPRFARAEAPRTCNIRDMAIGLNFVIFQGDVGHVFAGELYWDKGDRAPALKIPLLLNKSREQLTKIIKHTAKDVVVPLFKKNGFRLKKWYMPF